MVSLTNIFLLWHTGHTETIWLIGDSLIRRARDRALATHSTTLGTSSADVHWFGRGGALLQGFSKDLKRLLQANPPPSMLILHLGSNDIGRFEAKLCRDAIVAGISTIRSWLPHCLVIDFTQDVLPRLAEGTLFPKSPWWGEKVFKLVCQTAVEQVGEHVNNIPPRDIRIMPSAIPHRWGSSEQCRFGHLN